MLLWIFKVGIIGVVLIVRINGFCILRWLKNVLVCENEGDLRFCGIVYGNWIVLYNVVKEGLFIVFWIWFVKVGLLKFIISVKSVLVLLDYCFFVLLLLLIIF